MLKGQAAGVIPDHHRQLVSLWYWPLMHEGQETRVFGGRRLAGQRPPRQERQRQ
jgi:hypothetical protein